MESNTVLYPLLGGGLIGLAVTIMLLLNGRVTGISGIISNSLAKPRRDGLWRWYFLSGLVLGGALIQALRPDLLNNLTDRNANWVVLAGLLVGYGTVMGSGCTSGHGVCGISRFSIRSVIATLVFMAFGFFTVQIVQSFLGGSS